MRNVCACVALVVLGLVSASSANAQGQANRIDAIIAKDAFEQRRTTYHQNMLLFHKTHDDFVYWRDLYIAESGDVQGAADLYDAFYFGGSNNGWYAKYTEMRDRDDNAHISYDDGNSDLQAGDNWDGYGMTTWAMEYWYLAKIHYNIATGTYLVPIQESQLSTYQGYVADMKSLYELAKAANEQQQQQQ